MKRYTLQLLIPCWALAGLIFIQCNKPLNPLNHIVYIPQIVFAGTVNGDYDSLPGNADWPNRCTLSDDTVKMTFFSKDYHEINSIWQGDMMRLEVLPCSTCTTGTLSTRNIIFHMTRYWNDDYTWEIVPRDSVTTQNTIRMTIINLSREHGAGIAFDNIGATATALTGPQGLVIPDGRISGAIE